MPDPDRDPLTIAREVVRQHGHLDRDALSRREKERLDLARAVLAVSELADWLDNEADDAAAQGDTREAQCIRDEGLRIRNALTEAKKGNTP